MDELVARIVAAGLTSAIFTYFLVQLVVKPALRKQTDAWWTDLAMNGAALLIATVTAFGLMFLLADTMSQRVIIESLFTGVIAAATATFGHEVVKNYGVRNQVNIGEMEGNIHEIGDR